MCARCDLVRRTFATVVAAALFSSDDDEQPPTRLIANAIVSARETNCLSRIGARQLRPVPPAAPKRLEQRRGVGEPVRLRLHQAQPRLAISLIGVQDSEIAGIAVLVLKPGKIETRLGRIGGCCRRL